MSEVPPVNSGFLLGMVATVLFAVAYPLCWPCLRTDTCRLAGDISSTVRLSSSCSSWRRAYRLSSSSRLPSATSSKRRPRSCGGGSWRSPSRPACSKRLVATSAIACSCDEKKRRGPKLSCTALAMVVLESFVLVGGLTLLGPINLWSIASGGLANCRKTSARSRRSNCRCSTPTRMGRAAVRLGAAVDGADPGRVLSHCPAGLPTRQADLAALGRAGARFCGPCGGGTAASSRPGYRFITDYRGSSWCVRADAVWIIWRLRESPGAMRRQGASRWRRNSLPLEPSAHHDQSTRFKQVVHPTTRHWMHHLEVRGVRDPDDEVVAWIREAADRAG